MHWTRKNSITEHRKSFLHQVKWNYMDPDCHWLLVNAIDIKSMKLCREKVAVIVSCFFAKVSSFFSSKAMFCNSHNSSLYFRSLVNIALSDRHTWNLSTLVHIVHIGKYNIRKWPRKNKFPSKINKWPEKLRRYAPTEWSQSDPSVVPEWSNKGPRCPQDVIEIIIESVNRLSENWKICVAHYNLQSTCRS